MRIRQIVFIVLSAVLLAGCGRLKDIAVTSCALDSLTPRGFRGLDAELLVGINNPALEIGVEDIEGVLYMDGTPVATYTADPLKIQGHTETVYPVKCGAVIDGNLSLMDFLGMAVSFDPERFTTDIHAKVKLHSGVSKAFTLKKIPLSKFMSDDKEPRQYDKI